MVDIGTRNFQRTAGSTERAADAGLTLVLDSGRASHVNSVGASAQSCICWTLGHMRPELLPSAWEPILAICW